VEWDPIHPEDDLDENSQTFKTLRELKKKMDAAGLQMKMITCNLHGNTVFRKRITFQLKPAQSRANRMSLEEKCF